MEQQALNEYPEAIIKDFCLDNNYDFLCEENNIIMACGYRMKYDPYGADLEYTVILNQWTPEEFYDELSDWYPEYCNREDAVGNYLASQGLI